jgi:hypothetical protein
MASTEDERTILEELDLGRKADTGSTAADTDGAEDERSILDQLNHMRGYVDTLEDAARAARAVEFDQIRAVAEQLEAVAAAAKAAEHDLARELAETNRMSVVGARLVRDRLASTPRALGARCAG